MLLAVGRAMPSHANNHGRAAAAAQNSGAIRIPTTLNMTAPPPVLVESTAAHTRTGRAPLRSRSANVSGKPTGMNGPASEDSYGVPAKSAHAGGARLKKNRKTAAASAAAVVQPPSSTSYVTTTRGGSAAEDDNVLPLNLEKAIRLARPGSQRQHRHDEQQLASYWLARASLFFIPPLKLFLKKENTRV